MAKNLLHLLRNPELLERMVATRGLVVRMFVPILQSRYFIIAASIYLVLMLIMGPIVVSHYQIIRGTFEEGEALLVLPPPGPPPPPMPQQAISAGSAAAKQTTEVAVRSTATESTMQSARQSAATRLTVSAPSTYIQPSVPVVAPTIGAIEVKVGTDMGAKIADAEIKRLVGVRDFQRGWLVGGAGGVVGSSGGGGGGAGGPSGTYRHGAGRAVRARFTIFKAKYQEGDWNCNPEDLNNLMLQIRAWSRNRIEANLHPEVLDIGTDQIFTLKPPFIYLTGHKDFRLKDQEVKNIRDYLMLGGAVWADSALAGRRSRFDIAFRREMKRVLPDRDFQDVPPDHPVFDTFFDNIGMPSGINYYAEPIEMINIGNELAVIYTLNGYGHFWETRLNNEGKIQWNIINLSTNLADKPLWRNVYGPHLGHPRQTTSVLYRNINDDTVRDAYKFGINVVVHLLTRYQKYMKLLPLELPKQTEMRVQPPQQPTLDKTRNAPTTSNKPPAHIHRTFDKGITGMNTGRPVTAAPGGR